MCPFALSFVFFTHDRRRKKDRNDLICIELIFGKIRVKIKRGLLKISFISSAARNKVLERSEQVLISNTFALLSVNSVKNKVLERSEQVLISSTFALLSVNSVRNKVLERSEQVLICGYSIVVVRNPSKVQARARSPLPAPL